MLGQICKLFIRLEVEGRAVGMQIDLRNASLGGSVSGEPVHFAFGFNSEKRTYPVGQTGACQRRHNAFYRTLRRRISGTRYLRDAACFYYPLRVISRTA